MQPREYNCRFPSAPLTIQMERSPEHRVALKNGSSAKRRKKSESAGGRQKILLVSRFLRAKNQENLNKISTGYRTERLPGKVVHDPGTLTEHTFGLFP
jgi:hypothetical protein